MHGGVVGIAHNQPPAAGTPGWEAAADVLVQVAAVESALAGLGRRSVRLPFGRDLAGFVAAVRQAGVDRVFNLCESVDEDPLLIGHPAAVLELMGIPFTGSPASALMATTDKALVKFMLRGAGIPTPGFLCYDGGEFEGPADLTFPVILKPRFQDASIGIDQESVISRPAELAAAVRRHFSLYGPLVVEEFIAGREFNISLLGFPNARVLPLAEIDFSAMPAGLHRIVGYRAKWESDAPEYHATVRRFPTDLPLHLERNLRRLAGRAYRLCGLRDYGRVDLRVDGRGRPFVLEVNANPCLSPDAGFPAAVEESGLDYRAMVAQLLSYLDQRAGR